MIKKDDVEQLLSLRADGNLYHRESQTLEFKEAFNFAGLAEYFRDFSAFANNKGGWLIFGVKDKPKRELIGLSAKSYDQIDKLDPEKISGFLLDIFAGNIQWEHEVFSIGGKKFGVFYIARSKDKTYYMQKRRR